MGWLDSFLHPEKGYQAGQQQLNNYYNQAQGYQQPFMNNGQEAYGQLSPALQALLNPQAMQDKWSQGYQTSDYAKNLMNQAQQQGLESAGAQGLMGSSAALNAIQGGTTNIANADKQKYMDDLMQKYMQGIGLGQNIYGQGAQAAGQMGQNAMNMGQNSAGMAFGQQNAGGNMFGNLLGMGAGLLGGPIGGALGAGLSQKMGWSPEKSYNPNPGGWSLTGGAR